MAYQECITLIPYLKAVPDTRHARGKRYELWVLLSILCVALISGQKTVWGIVEWALLHAAELLAALDWPKQRLPSASTFYVTLRNIGIAGLEGKIAEMGSAMERENRPSETLRGADGGPLRGQAVDGKDVRGARAHGDQTYLVSLVGHGDGVVLGQERVDAKTNEITVVPKLLAGRDLQGTVVTMDALLTQRAIAQQVLDQGGDYLMVVKLNQPQLWANIDLLFESPPLSSARVKKTARRSSCTARPTDAKRNARWRPVPSYAIIWTGRGQSRSCGAPMMRLTHARVR